MRIFIIIIFAPLHAFELCIWDSWKLLFVKFFFFFGVFGVDELSAKFTL